MNVIDFSSFLSDPDQHLAQPLPPSLRGSFDALDAALWLIAGDNLPQALSMLHNSIELAMKAELIKIHPLLIADIKRLDYESLKMFMKDEFLKHKRGAKLKIKSLDLERTITFTDALIRLKEIYHELNNWEQKLKILQNYRNQITHTGAKKDEYGEYAYIIISIAIPFLSEFYRITNQFLLEEDLQGISREIQVAQKVSDRLETEHLPKSSYILRTLRWKILKLSIQPPEPEDEEGYQASFDKDFVLGQQGERKINREWGMDYYVETFCKICDCVRTFVRVQPIKEPSLGLLPIAVYCPVCGLHIKESEKYLAMYHIGEFDQETIDKFFKENHEALEYDGFF